MIDWRPGTTSEVLRKILVAGAAVVAASVITPTPKPKNAETPDDQTKFKQANPHG